MNKSFVTLAVILALIVALTQATNYAIIVAGSDNYYNYRHQSDIAHHYQLLIQRGYKPENIISFLKDDLVESRSNPFPGATYNTPCPTCEGINYYKGIKIDYAGAKVTPENFVNAFIGNDTGIGPVLQTGPNDNILFLFSDHGAPGLLAFPSTELYVKEFKNSIDNLITNKKFNKLAIYIEACESGSMCKGVIPADSNVICLTASDENQSSWAKFCGSEAQVNGKSIGSCLADEFAWALADYIDNNGVSGTIGDHYTYLVKEVAKSPVQWFGNEEYKNWKISEFFASTTFTEAEDQQLVAQFKSSPLSKPIDSGVRVNSRDNTLHFLTERYLDVDQSLGFEERITAGEELLQELQNRLIADKRFTRIAQKVSSSIQQQSNSGLLGAMAATSFHTMKSSVNAIDCGRCCETAFKYISYSACKFDDYSLKYAKTIHNICTFSGQDVTRNVLEALQQECQF